MTFETDAIHAGYDSQYNLYAASVPIYATAAFDMASALHGDELASGEKQGFPIPESPIPPSIFSKKGLRGLKEVSVRWPSVPVWQRFPMLYCA